MRTALAGHDGPTSRADHRTVDAIFRHPAAENLAWRDVLSLFHATGEVEEKQNGKVVVKIGAGHLTLKRPHGDHVPAAEVVDLRHFLLDSGCAPASPPGEQGHLSNPDLLVVVDHRKSRIFRLDLRSRDVVEHSIEPYDPHHFLHHLSHKDQPREPGQRVHEDTGFYEEISSALVAAGRIVVVGHGVGHSNAAMHLVEYLCTYYHTVFERLAQVVTADFSAMTDFQLLVAGRRALSEEVHGHIGAT